MKNLYRELYRFFNENLDPSAALSAHRLLRMTLYKEIMVEKTAPERALFF